MSQENVELVRDAFQAFTAEGIDAALPFFPPDVVWHTTDRWLEGSAYRGRDGMRRLAEAFAENFDGIGYEIQDMHDAEDRVVALVHMTGKIKNSRQSISQPLGLVVSDFRDGTFGRIRAFASWHEALEAVGLAAG
jgi:ketosteroid isomerase-like protein